MTHPFETPGQMRTRMDKGAKTAIGGQMMSPDAPITKRISQPRIESSELAARIPEIRAWLQAWKDEEARTEGLTLATTKKSSAGLRFSVPSSITFASLEDYVAWIGSTQDYQVAGRRIGELTDLDARLFGMTRIWQGLAALSEPDFLSFLELLRWRRDNPDSHPPVRALAIPGLDTKWIEGHQMLVKAAFHLLGALNPDGESALERLGFDTCDRMTVWFRCGAGIGGMAALAPQFALRPSDTTPSQVAGARRAIIVENQTSFEMLELGPRDIAIFGQGGQAPAALGLMPWLHEALDEILYWGDMDGEGYRILSRARAVLPELRSILMDAQAAHDHIEALSVSIDTDPRPVPDRLNDTETSAYTLLAPAGRRIEQERIPRQQVVAALAQPDALARSA